MHTLSRAIKEVHHWPADDRWPDGSPFKNGFLAQCIVDGCTEASEAQPVFIDSDGELFLGSPSPLKEGLCSGHNQ